jgi:cytochrome P450
MTRITGRDRVAAILEDPAYVVPPAAPGPFGTLAWLRASVCRFAEGDDHARRRALVEARLAGVDPDVPLARALGITADVEDDVNAVAAVYVSGGPGADDAVARLVEAVGPGDPEAVAADICILVQAARARTVPPTSTRRIGPDGEVELDLSELPFGAGRHRCPGERPARA